MFEYDLLESLLVVLVSLFMVWQRERLDAD